MINFPRCSGRTDTEIPGIGTDKLGQRPPWISVCIGNGIRDEYVKSIHLKKNLLKTYKILPDFTIFMMIWDQ